MSAEGSGGTGGRATVKLNAFGAACTTARGARASLLIAQQKSERPAAQILSAAGRTSIEIRDAKRP